MSHICYSRPRLVIIPMIWQLWFNLLPPCPALLCMSHTLNSTQVSSNVVKSGTKKRQRVLVRLSIHILDIVNAHMSVFCGDYFSEAFRQNETAKCCSWESSWSVKMCKLSAKPLSNVTQVKNLSENVTQRKSMSGLLWRSRSAMSTNICKHLSDRILGESETTSKTHKKQTRPSCIMLGSIKNGIDQFRTLNCFWPQVRPSNQDVLCICCPPTDCSAIYLHSDWFLSSDCSLFLTSHCSVFVTSHCWVSPLIAQFSLSFDCLQFLPSNCPLLSLEKINILPHTAGVCCISSCSEH